MTNSEKVLEFFPRIKALGLTVTDYNCTWYVNAEQLEGILERDHMKLYIITENGYAITNKLTMEQVLEKFGSVKQLEAAGYRVVET